MKILISGSSGLVGYSLISYFEKQGHSIIKLIRNANVMKRDEIFIDLNQTNIEKMNTKLLEGFDVIIHLAGENISNGFWTEKKKGLIEKSRVRNTTTLTKILSTLKNPPKLFICASAIGYYGNRDAEVLNENSSAGKTFLAEVCQKWENATKLLNRNGTRVTNLRFGVILSLQGGMLKKLILPFRLGLGGIIGTGHQFMSWVAIDDVLKIIEFIMFQDSLEGPINVVSPNPVTNEVFTKTLAKVLNRPAWMNVPTPLTRFIFGQMADELLLSSARVLPEKLLNSGYQFSFPDLKIALEHLISKRS